jgi:DNA repair ATPase RecN
MSGKPYPEGVTQVIRHLERIEQLNDRISELAPLVVELKNARAEIEAVSEELGSMLSKMDVESQGNYGFEGRMGWFLSEMRRQILSSAKEKDEPVPAGDHQKQDSAGNASDSLDSGRSRESSEAPKLRRLEAAIAAYNESDESSGDTVEWLKAARLDLAEAVAEKDRQIEGLRVQRDYEWEQRKANDKQIAELKASADRWAAKWAEMNTCYHDQQKRADDLQAWKVSATSVMNEIEELRPIVHRHGAKPTASVISEACRIVAELEQRLASAGKGEALTEEEVTAVVDAWTAAPFPPGEYRSLVAQENAGILQLAQMAAEAQLLKVSK